MILNKVFLLILVFPFFEPIGFITYLGDTWSKAWHYLVLSDVILLLAILIFVIKKANKVYLLYGFFFVPIALSTILNSGELLAAVYFPARMIGFIILVDYYSMINKLHELLSVIKNLLGCYFLINLFFQYVQQDFFGYTSSSNFSNFFQSDNFQGYWYITFILVVFMVNYRKSRKRQIIEMLFWICICLASLIKAWAATCLAVFVVFAVLVFLRTNPRFQLLTPWTGYLTNVVINVLIVFFHIQYLFSWLIVDILQKDLTLTSRTAVWASAILNIMKKPLLGYGTNLNGRMSINYNSSLSIFNFSHNVFLEITIQGGLIAFVMLAVLYFMAAGEIRVCHSDDSGIKTMISISLFCILLMQFSEFILYEPFVNLPLILCFYYKRLLSELKIGNKICDKTEVRPAVISLSPQRKRQA